VALQVFVSSERLPTVCAENHLESERRAKARITENANRLEAEDDDSQKNRRAICYGKALKRA
jgi:hypothetical protein